MSPQNQEFQLPDFDDVTAAKPTTARGGQVRLGRHRVTIRQASYFRGNNTDKALTCAIESVVVRTAQTDHFNNLLTEEETKVGIGPYDQDTPHSTGEVIATVWKKAGRAAQMFDGNVNGFMTHAKHSLFNMIEAYEKLGMQSAADDIRKAYSEFGLDMSPSARNQITNQDGKAIFNPEIQAFRGLDLYVVARRVKTHAGHRINAAAYDPIPVAEWMAEIKASMTEAA